MKSRASITSWKRAALAALIAYALVLQTVLISLSGAAHAADIAAPQGILCVKGGAAEPDQAPGKAHDGLCCILSCHGSGPAGPAPEGVFVEGRDAVPAALHLGTRSSRVAFFSHVLPVGSRAPPRLG